MFAFRAGLSLSRKHYSSILSLRTGHLVHSRSLLSHRPYPIAPFSTTVMQNSPKSPDANAKRRKKTKVDREKSSGFDEVLQADIDNLLRKHKPESEIGVEDASTPPPASSLPETFTEIEVKVAEISSTGDGLALSEDANHVYVVPFTVPGDKALVKVIRHFPSLSYSLTDFLKVVEPGPQRNDAGIGCQYFGKCSGCQLQMMSYEDQLAHKKRIVEKAYANFSGLIPELIPAIDDTFPSPLQYGYRTKLTPHFAGPGGNRRSKAPKQPHTEVPPIGFTMKNQRRDLDIEDCPLGTDIVRKGLKSERTRVAENIGKYKKGATILLRESTARIPKDDVDPGSAVKDREIEVGEDSGDVIHIEREKYTEEKRCVTDPNGTSVEYIDDYFFSNRAGAFFQNNNSILSGFTEYIRQLALPKHTQQDSKPIKYLLDAYSGSGLFTITLSPLFKSSLGVDVSGDSIVSARENARANSLPNTGFAAADAATLFKDVPYPPDQTLLVIDPPRKGCSDDFLRQLLTFGPRRVVYVSCNVHTQARDVAVMVQGDKEKNIRFEIESIRGFDFFPQTGHVEGVAILNKTTF
ncbi:S-adenosyl-L-methionine-dependent methyltransferase [Aspergillus minisclerotigenes]|uniref:tRNA (uracil(54)-C(5))-methyltransferase n=1 Tax=Aspergillus minisclerotigenes TaxID=656917 RepID=A0A5N6J5K9_9EURO|nr:S-adenosyl-L-methionine-dependent methyltransferase [Aspergillus minisclerotigenes]